MGSENSNVLCVTVVLPHLSIDPSTTSILTLLGWLPHHTPFALRFLDSEKREYNLVLRTRDTVWHH
jgi:hypothetical protein